MNVLFVIKNLLGNDEIFIIHQKMICSECQKKISLNYDDKVIDNAFDTITRFNNIIMGPHIANMNNELEKNEKVTQINNYMNNKKFLPKNNSLKINSYDIYQRVIKKVIGHDSQVKRVLSIIIRNLLTNDSNLKTNMFLIGHTGVGKTFTVEQILKELDIPYIDEAATSYTEEGYVGDSVSDLLERLIKAANDDIRKAERGVIILDEADKLADTSENSKVSNVSVQESLLKIIEGTVVYTKKGPINTEFITFVFAGSFEKAYKAREKRLRNKGKIGFCTDSDTDSNLKNELKNANFIKKDLIEAGLISEFAGRIGRIIEFLNLHLDDIIKYLNMSEVSILDSFFKEFKKLNVDVIMDREEIGIEIAQKAIQSETGIRGVIDVVNEMFEMAYADLTVGTINPLDGYECYITKETVYDNSKFKLCKKKRQN